MTMTMHGWQFFLPATNKRSVPVSTKDVHHALTAEGVSIEALRAELSLFFEAPGTLEKPVIAAINGHCVGEGMVMTLFCDLRIAADDAQFSLPEARIGVPSINGTIRAVQIAGHAAAMELVLTGEPRDAAWARNAGFVNAVVPAGRLMAEARGMADAIAGNDAAAYQVMRELGERALQEPFSDLLAQGMVLRDALTADAMIERQGKWLERPHDDT